MVFKTLGLLCLMENSQQSCLFGNQDVIFAVLLLLLDYDFGKSNKILGTHASESQRFCFPNLQLITLTQELVLCHDPKPLDQTVLCAPLESGFGQQLGNWWPFPLWESMTLWTLQLLDDIFCLILSASPVTPFPASQSRVRFYVKYFLG